MCSAGCVAGLLGTHLLPLPFFFSVDIDYKFISIFFVTLPSRWECDEFPRVSPFFLGYRDTYNIHPPFLQSSPLKEASKYISFFFLFPFLRLWPSFMLSGMYDITQSSCNKSLVL